MPRGRPTKSVIRDNMIEIVGVLGKAYGYEIYKIYREIFPKVTLRVMYYHLRKGVDLGEFKKHKVIVETGDYSWGNSAEKILYTLGRNGKPKGDPRVREFLEKRRKQKK
jgi:hypothetical protein